MQASKEISLKLKELEKIRRKIRQNKIYAFRLSLEDPQDFDSNSFQDEINELQLQEIHTLQEIQQIKREIQAQFNPYSLSPLIRALEAA
jgi:isoleucyl-tRNA synthetase